MAGKYEKVLERLPKFKEEAKLQDKIQETKRFILSKIPRHASALAAHYVQVRLLKKALDEKRKKLNIEEAAIIQLMDEQFDAEGTTSLTLSSGANVRLQYEPYATVKDRELFRLWCIENGLERSLMLPWSTTNSTVKELLLAGEPEPPGIATYNKVKGVFKSGGAVLEDESELNVDFEEGENE